MKYEINGRKISLEPSI